jgi:hypothetical protein
MSNVITAKAAGDHRMRSQGAFKAPTNTASAHPCSTPFTQSLQASTEASVPPSKRRPASAWFLDRPVSVYRARP